MRNVASCSLCLDASGADDLAPLFGLRGDELGELGWRARKGPQAQFGKLALERRVRESCVDLLIERRDDLRRRVRRRTQAGPTAGFVAWNGISLIRESLRASLAAAPVVIR